MRKISLIYPRGTYRIPPTYFRGGDIYKESEFIDGEAKKAISQFKLTKQRLIKARTEYSAAENEGCFAEEYTIQMAENLGENSKETTINNDLRQRINTATVEMEKLDKEIQEIKAKICPSELSPLVNEQASFIPDLESLNHQIQRSRSKIIESKRRIARILISPQYSYACDSYTEYEVAEKTRSQLRSTMTNKFSSMGMQKSKSIGKRSTLANEALHNEGASITPLLDELVDTHLKLTETQLRLSLAKTHEQMLTNSLLKQLEDMYNLCNLDIDMESIRDNVKRDFNAKEDEELFVTSKYQSENPRDPQFETDEAEMDDNYENQSETKERGTNKQNNEKGKTSSRRQTQQESDDDFDDFSSVTSSSSPPKKSLVPPFKKPLRPMKTSTTPRSSRSTARSRQNDSLTDSTTVDDQKFFDREPAKLTTSPQSPDQTNNYETFTIDDHDSHETPRRERENSMIASPQPKKKSSSSDSSDDNLEDTTIINEPSENVDKKENDEKKTEDKDNKQQTNTEEIHIDDHDSSESDSEEIRELLKSDSDDESKEKENDAKSDSSKEKNESSKSKEESIIEKENSHQSNDKKESDKGAPKERNIGKESDKETSKESSKITESGKDKQKQNKEKSKKKKEKSSEKEKSKEEYDDILSGSEYYYSESESESESDKNKNEKSKESKDFEDDFEETSKKSSARSKESKETNEHSNDFDDTGDKVKLSGLIKSTIKKDSDK